jgi:hypothetical protein
VLSQLFDSAFILASTNVRFGIADWHARTEFWNVEDIGVTPSPVALAAIQERIEALMGPLTSDTRERG